MLKENTLTIMSCYDKEGIIDDSVLFYLEELKQVSNRIIVTINGIVTKDSMNKLNKLDVELYIRENTGFDFGAYKDTFEKYLMNEKPEQYSRIILCNDTCFGPFISFKDIFARMESSDADMWSMNYADDMLIPYFQSYFMVFRNRAISILVSFLENEVYADNLILEQVHGYEHALSEVILQSGIKTDYYTSHIEADHCIDIYRSPNYALKKLKLPVLKKRAFSENGIESNYCDALRYIEEADVYPIQFIRSTVYRRYHKEIRSGEEKKTIDCYFEKNRTSRERMIEFCQSNEEIYLYGDGYLSILILARFKRYMKNFAGYIVSDEYYKKDFDHGHRIYRLSEIDKDAAIVVSLMQQYSTQVKVKLQNWSNVLFLSISR